jgi:hypothetical protein
MLLARALEGLRPSMIVHAPEGFALHDYVLKTASKSVEK